MSLPDRPYLKCVRPSYMPKFVPDSTCVLWLPGQDDPYSATIRDRSGNVNNGAITGATWVRSGKRLWVLRGAGDSYVETSSNLTKGLTTVTVMGWINPSDLSTNYGIFGDNTDATNSSLVGELLDVPATGTWRLSLYVKEEDTARSQLLCSTTIVPYSSWTFWGVTWSPASGIIGYINGAADGSKALGGTRLESTVTKGTSWISYGTTVGRMTGDAWGFRVFNAVLTPTQFTGIFQQERHLFQV